MPTSNMEIIKVSGLLKASASTEIDDINPSIAMSTIYIIATPLTSIINSSFNLGLVPDSFKIAKITPIFKSGDNKSITKYRPISVLPFFSKVIKNLMANRLTEYLGKYALLSPTQFGFQRIIDLHGPIRFANEHK